MFQRITKLERIMKAEQENIVFVQKLEKANADLEYLAMMTDVEMADMTDTDTQGEKENE